MKDYDVIIVGGGHAGIEAAHAAAKLTAKIALCIPNPEKIGLMPCNPAIGGPGKSQLVFELHALGGVMGHLADETAIHARTLNASKGPAVQSLRVQNERDNYASCARALLENIKNLDIIRGEVAELLSENNILKGLTLTDGRQFKTKSIVLCTGTFLKGVVWYGTKQREAGRQGEAPARYLSKSLENTGHKLMRFKTGTPPRIRSSSINFSSLEIVHGDKPPSSFTGKLGAKVDSTPTWLTHTTTDTHKLIMEKLEHSAMYSGEISGQGPRYCPSIEDKVVRFKDKERHLLFVEPDGIETSEVYLQGFSSSMPPYLQDDMIRTLPGFEKAVIQRYAYAVEYDALDPTQLTTSLMSKKLAGLFSAGQINGTSGYEEAAAQGLIAGVNAAKYALGEELVNIQRDEGYIGVLLDDIVRWGINEPYRMLTSRNEYRLLHRQDNAAERLLLRGYKWGLVTQDALIAMQNSQDKVTKEVERFNNTYHKGKLASKILSQPQQNYQATVKLIGESLNKLTFKEQQKVEILVKYAAYIKRSQKELAARKEYEQLSLKTIDFHKVASLSKEGLDSLLKYQPANLGSAQRLRGIRDSDITALLIYTKTKNLAVSRETDPSLKL